MKQTTFPFDDPASDPPALEIDPELEQQLLESMTQAIVFVFQSIEANEHDPA